MENKPIIPDESSNENLVFIITDILKGTSKEDIFEKARLKNLNDVEIEHLYRKALCNLENPEYRKKMVQYVQKIDMIESLQDYYTSIVIDNNAPNRVKKSMKDVAIDDVAKSNIDDMKDFDLLSPPVKLKLLINRMMDEVMKVLDSEKDPTTSAEDFLFNILKINRFMGWTEFEDKAILLNMGFDEQEIEENLSIFSKRFRNISDEKRENERLTIDNTRLIIEPQIQQGSLKEDVVRKLVKAGWREELGWYFVTAIELKPIFNSLFEESVEKASEKMYYGENIVLPGENKWGELSEAQREDMNFRREEFFGWAHMSNLIGFISYSVITPFSGLFLSFLISLVLILIFTIIFSYWYNQTLSIILSKARFLIIVGGIIYSLTWLELEFLPIALHFLIYVGINFIGYHIITSIRNRVWLSKNNEEANK